MPIATDSQSTNANGGTESMKRELVARINSNILDHFQIFVSRVEQPFDETKIRIYYAHDLESDPAAEHALGSGRWANFHLCIFVSNWQMQRFIERYNIPWSHCVVLLNAIKPFEDRVQPEGPMRMAYWSTPHRGLNILLPVFEKLQQEFPDIHLDVFSSYKLYGWEHRDAEYQQLFDRCDHNPNITYHGTKSNEELREHLRGVHIMAYPSTWMETSCICLMESMSAGILAVHPNYGALSETAANWTAQYQWHEDPNQHAVRFYHTLRNAIVNYEHHSSMIASASSYANVFYNWDSRQQQWEMLLTALIESVHDRTLPDPTQPVWSYSS